MIPSESESLTAQRKFGLYPLHAHSKEAGRFVDGKYDSFYPFEQGNIAVSTISKESSDLDSEVVILEAYVALAEATDTTTAPMDAETLKQLEALGYMGGVVDGITQETDPRDVIPLTWEIRQLLGRGALQMAEERFDKLSAKMGDSLGVLELQASILQNKGEIFQAIDIYTEVFHQSKNSTVA